MVEQILIRPSSSTSIRRTETRENIASHSFRVDGWMDLKLHLGNLSILVIGTLLQITSSQVHHMLLGFFGHLVNFDHGNWMFQAPELARSSGHALMYVGFLGTLAKDFGYSPASFVLFKLSFLVSTFACLACCGSAVLSYGVLDVFLKGQLQQSLYEYERQTYLNKSTDDMFLTWGFLQYNLHCCGAENYTDWAKLTGFPEEGFVPTNCCKMRSGNFTGCSNGITRYNLYNVTVASKYVYTDGCAEAGVAKFKEGYWVTYAIVLFAISLLNYKWKPVRRDD